MKERHKSGVCAPRLAIGLAGRVAKTPRNNAPYFLPFFFVPQSVDDPPGEERAKGRSKKLREKKYPENALIPRFLTCPVAVGSNPYFFPVFELRNDHTTKRGERTRVNHFYSVSPTLRAQTKTTGVPDAAKISLRALPLFLIQIPSAVFRPLKRHFCPLLTTLFLVAVKKGILSRTSKGRPSPLSFFYVHMWRI